MTFGTVSPFEKEEEKLFFRISIFQKIHLKSVQICNERIAYLDTQIVKFRFLYH